MRAPAVLAGTILLAALFTVPAAAAAREALWLHAGSVWSLWLLGYGPLARVISPPELAAQILDQLERAQALYE